MPSRVRLSGTDRFPRFAEKSCGWGSPLGDEVAGVLDLRDGVELRQVHLLAFPLGELRPQGKRPVVQLLANDLRAEPIGSGLQRGESVNSQQGVVVFAEADLAAVQLLLHEGVAVEVVGTLKGEGGCHPHDGGPQHFIANVVVVVREAAPLVRQNAMVGILRGTLRQADGEGRACSKPLKMK